MVTVKSIKSKTTPAKKTITIKDVIVSKMKFVDETGDVTQQILKELPEGTERISFKITVEIPEEEQGR